MRQRHDEQGVAPQEVKPQIACAVPVRRRDALFPARARNAGTGHGRYVRGSSEAGARPGRNRRARKAKWFPRIWRSVGEQRVHAETGSNGHEASARRAAAATWRCDGRGADRQGQWHGTADATRVPAAGLPQRRRKRLTRRSCVRGKTSMASTRVRQLPMPRRGRLPLHQS